MQVWGSDSGWNLANMIGVSHATACVLPDNIRDKYQIRLKVFRST